MAFSFSKQYSAERKFDVSTEGMDYISLKDLLRDNDYGIVKAHRIKALYINRKSEFDPAPVAMIDDYLVNLPSHLTNQCEKILEDRRAVSAINQGIVGFTIYSYLEPKYKKQCYSIKWVDMDPPESEEYTEAEVEG